MVVERADQLLAEQDSILMELKQNLIKAQQRMKQHTDNGRKEVEFKVGDMMFLTAQPCRKSVAKRVNEKLNPRFYYPFLIVERV